MNDSDYHCARQIGVTKAIIVPIISLKILNYSRSHFSIDNLSQRGQNCTNVSTNV